MQEKQCVLINKRTNRIIPILPKRHRLWTKDGPQTVTSSILIPIIKSKLTSSVKINTFSPALFLTPVMKIQPLIYSVVVIFIGKRRFHMIFMRTNELKGRAIYLPDIERHRSSVIVVQLFHSWTRTFSFRIKICIHCVFGEYQTCYLVLFFSFWCNCILSLVAWNDDSN